MAFLKIDQDGFDTERKVVEEERRLGLNQPYGTVPEKRRSPNSSRTAPTAGRRSATSRTCGPRRSTTCATSGTRTTCRTTPRSSSSATSSTTTCTRWREKYFGWIPRGADDPPRVTAPSRSRPSRATVEISRANGPVPLVGFVFRTVPERPRGRGGAGAAHAPSSAAARAAGSTSTSSPRSKSRSSRWPARSRSSRTASSAPAPRSPPFGDTEPGVERSWSRSRRSKPSRHRRGAGQGQAATAQGASGRGG